MKRLLKATAEFKRAAVNRVAAGKIGLGGAARAQFAGAAGVLGLVEGWASGTGHG
jgi:hypothetical protein